MGGRFNALPVQETRAIGARMHLRLLLALLCLFVTLPAAAQQAQPPEGPDWPFAASDLPVDPQYRFGTLPNGMRYIIRPNSTPAGQAKVQLRIGTGSVAESEDERGFAHFIEHMAFNGSTNVPEGEMVRLLEREGLAFGADTNASTSFDETIYKLDLPRADPALLDTALMLMRETASELTFDPAAVEREKGVVLSERRVRDTYDYNDTLDELEFLFPEGRFAQRLPIGTQEAIANASADDLRSFWQQHYRPANTALIVIGDFDADATEAAIRKHFADWPAAAPVQAPDFGPVDYDLAGETDIYLDPALSERVTISRHGPFITPPDTVASRRERVLREIGYAIVNRRLLRLTRAEDPPYQGAGLGTSEVFKVGRTTKLIVDAGDGEWRPALAAAQEVYRRALEYGFSGAEVAEQVANLRADIENNAAAATTRSNSTFVTGALTLLEDGQVPTTPQSALERFTAAAPLITPEAVIAALEKDLVPLDDPLIRFEGRTAPDGGAEALREAWEDGTHLPLDPQADSDLAEFAYTDFGPAGTIASDTTEPLLGIREINFANGLKLNLKSTDLARDRVMVELNVDGGDMLETTDDPLATAMTGSLTSGGLGAHTVDELQSILAGRDVSFDVSSEAETFRMQARTTPRDLELQLQLMTAALTDAAYRPQGEAQYRRNVANYFAQLAATPGDAMSNALGGIVSGGDPRFTLQPEADYMALTFAHLRDEIGDRLANGALELALVGDFDEQAAIDAVARTLGALPAREPQFRDYGNNRFRAFTADRTARTIYHDGAADQALLRMAWPTTDDSDFATSLTLELLERVAQLGLVESLREELGQTYSPGVSAAQSRIYPGYGTFSLSAAVDASQVDAAREAMLATIRSIGEQGVDADTLLRARQPLLEAYDNALKTNRGWMNLVDRAQTQSDRIERFTRGRALLQSITPEQVQAMAARYLVPDQRLEVLALPRPNDTPAAP